MKTTQPPITNDQELAGYQEGAQRLRAMIERHESDLMAQRQRAAADLQRIDQIRYQLHHLYGYYKGIQDAIAVYLHHRQTA
ncbi:MAG TPA: hypothetical protein VE338_11580 [Ktedonobacterales bacterium]|jgi:hypothetical protein|nr:hypothetical protein [Ktedonobacterales bacterium]